LDFDEGAMRSLPVGRDPDSTAQRKKLFRQADMNGNGICSLAECDRLIVTVLNIKGVRIMKPVINRAFHAARDIVPSVGTISPHYVDLHEFRYFLLYLMHYLDMFLVFCACDSTKVRGKYSDRRMSYPEFERAIPMLLDWGLEDDVERVVQAHPQAVFQVIDDNGGGVVLFDEFAHWALWFHCFKQDGDDDEDMVEALEVLKKQKPNLCGKDLTSIRASKAKYRADARISGQGCLGGDPSLAGGYDEIPDGGKELADGRHYPGGLKAWQACFHGKGQDKPGRYRCVAAKMFVSTSVDLPTGGPRVGTITNGTEFNVLEVEERTDLKRVRARIQDPDGWVSLMKTTNSFRWAVQLRQQKKRRPPGGGEYATKAVAPPGDMCMREVDEPVLSSAPVDSAVREVEAVLGTAWRDSFSRVEEASDAYEREGEPLCENDCGQPRFGRYTTCCTHCRGPTGPHAQSCMKKGYDECENGCGHPQFGKYSTCCTHCKGKDGPHARGCFRIEKAASGGAAGGCEKGCGRPRFKSYPTCCTRCSGPGSEHARDCDERNPPQEAPIIVAQSAVVTPQAQPERNPSGVDGIVNEVRRMVSSVCTVS